MNPTVPLVGDFMSIDPVVITAEATLDDAASLLNAYDVTGLPVVDAAGRPVGVISQTDLLAARESLSRLIRGHVSTLRVGEVMSSPALTVNVLTDMHDAGRLMLEARVHRLVAIDDAGRAVGVLSATDFVELYVDGGAASVRLPS